MKHDINCNFSEMSRTQLLEFCRNLYAEGGIAAFTYPALKTIPKLYYNLYRKDLPQKLLLQELGIDQEYKQFILSKSYSYGGTFRERWTWDVVVKRALAIKKSVGHLPPALWFQKNGHASLVTTLYSLGRSWADIREAVGDFSGSNFVQSRNGLRWLSHAEASLSNFLYVRGIEHKKGERYGESFTQFSTARYAIYDLHFLGNNREWFDVEIWGDKPNGHNEEKYAETRVAKEAFNCGNLNFLGIHHRDCYDEKKLTEILRSSIGRIAPFQFDKPTDSKIYSTHWSNADELLDFCKALALKMPNRQFPAEDWLRKRGRWANRDGDAYNTLAVYIKLWLGGIRNLRKLIGQAEASTQQWDKESALSAYRDFYDKHGLTPGQVKHDFYHKADSVVSEEFALEAARVSSAVEKYAGGTSTANEALGIEVVRQIKWPRDVIVDVVKSIANEYGLSPNQLLYDQRKGRIELPKEKLTEIKQLIDAISRSHHGLAGIYSELGIQKPKRNRRKISKLG